MMKRLNSRSCVLLTLVLLFSTLEALGRRDDNKKTLFYLQIFGDYHYSGTSADEVSGAKYSKTIANPIIAGLGFGAEVSPNVYLGLRYEYWAAGRKFELNSVTQTDTLNYQTLGVELGYTDGNPRVFWIVAAGVHNPLQFEVKSDSGNFTGTKRVAFSGRVTLGVRFHKIYSLLLDTGYRLQNLGKLSLNGTPYLPGEADFNLSGGFVGIGLFFHF